MPQIATFAELQALPASEKIALIQIEASKRLIGWELYSGSVYRLAFEYAVIVSIKEEGVALTAAASIAAVSAGKYYFDRENRYLYLQASDSSNPNSKFQACTFKLFFSDKTVKAPWDLASGFEVEWVKAIETTSEFGVGLDNNYQFGLALEGDGQLILMNDQSFWASRYDKLTFENQRVFVYLWSRLIPITEAKLIYRGRIQGKTWALDAITFDLKDFLNELRLPVELENMEDVSGARLPDSLLKAKQRLLYGYLYSHRPTNYDQIVGGYPFTGTVNITNGNATVTGSGTSFLSQATEGDQVLVAGTTQLATIKTVDSNTQLTLSEIYRGATALGATLLVKPSRGRRWMNRLFKVAGHALREPSTTVTAAPNTMQFTVADATDILPNDYLIIGSETVVVQRVSGNVIRLSTSLNTVPTLGTAVVRPAVTNVYLNARLLTLTRDFTYSAANARITLDPLAEFNVAPVESLTGTVTFTNTSRTVTGSNTFFKADLKPGDWINRTGQSDWFEVLSVESDESLTLRSAATYTQTGAALVKHPEYYHEGSVILTCDCLGATADGTTAGIFLKTGPAIVRDLLTRAGLASSIVDASFDDSSDVASYRLGLKIPETYNGKKAPLYRDVIGDINQSIFGGLVQNEDFQFEYSVLSPKIPESSVKLKQPDVLGFSIESDAERIVKNVKVNYLFREYEPNSKDNTNSVAEATSKSGNYLAQTSKEFEIDTILTDEAAAQIFAYRWAMLLGVASSVVKFRTKLQGARVQVTDKVEIEHPKFYERIGSSDRRKIAGVQTIKQTSGTVTIELEDLANAFSRCCIISEGGSSNYENSSDEDRARHGFITDSYGMMDNDPETYGKNQIW